MKYLRSKASGVVFDYNDRMAKDPAVEVITEREAYPERFAPVDLTKREVKVNVAIKEEVAAPPHVAPELVAQRGVTFATSPTLKVRVKKNAGLEGE